MTIIAVEGKFMAADSASYQGQIMHKAPEPKIIRTHDGGLIGATGATGDCHILRRWVADGMNFEKPPRFSFPNPEHDDSVLWLWLRPDWTVHMGDCVLNHWPVPPPCSIGMGTQYLHGLLHGGVPLAVAVGLTIQRVPYLGGAVQCESVA